MFAFNSSKLSKKRKTGSSIQAPKFSVPLTLLDTNVHHSNYLSKVRRETFSSIPEKKVLANNRKSSIGPPQLSSFGLSGHQNPGSSRASLYDSTRTLTFKSRGDIKRQIPENEESKCSKKVFVNNNVNNDIDNVGSLKNKIAISTPIANQSKDKRPLRDKQYQETIKNEIYSFLMTCGFESDTKHLLTEKTLRNPTQKDFIVIFNWLFKQLDPGHSLTKIDIIALLKIIQYPFYDTITRSQLAAVGGQNWHIFLGMLHWLVKCCEVVKTVGSDFQKDEEIVEYSEVEFDAGEALNSMFFKYTKNTYKLFMLDNDNYDVVRHELNNDFERLRQFIDNSIESLRSETEKLGEEFQCLANEEKAIENGNRRTRALETDIVKFTDYIKSIEVKKIKWKVNIDKLNSEIWNLDARLQVIKDDTKNIDNMITKNGLSLVDVKRVIKDQISATNDLSKIDNLFEESNEKFNNSKTRINSKLEFLKKIISNFNSDVSHIIGTNSEELEIEVSSILLNENQIITCIENWRPNIGLTDQNLKHIKDNMKQLQKKIRELIFNEKDELIKLQNSIDLLSENITGKLEISNELETRLNSNKMEADQIFSFMTLESSSAMTEFERLEIKMQVTKRSIDSRNTEIDRLLSSKEMDAERADNEMLIMQKGFHKEVERIINEVVNFKIDIQETLEILAENVQKDLRDAVQ